MAASLEPTHRHLHPSDHEPAGHFRTLPQQHHSQSSLDLPGHDLVENQSFTANTADLNNTAASAKTTEQNPMGNTVRAKMGEGPRTSGKESLREGVFQKPNIRILVSEARKRMTRAAEEGASQERASFEERSNPNKVVFKAYKALSPVKLKSISFIDKFERRKRSDDKSKSPVRMVETFRAATPTRVRPSTSPLPYKTEESRERARTPLAEVGKEEIANIRVFSARYL